MTLKPRSAATSRDSSGEKKTDVGESSKNSKALNVPTNNGALTLFDYIRNQLRLAITVLFLIYAVIFGLMTHATARDLLVEPIYHLAWACLVIAVLTVTGRVRGMKANLAVQVAMLPLLVYAGLTQGNVPLSQQVAFLFWCALALLPLFLHGGIKFGAFGSAFVIGSLSAAVLSGHLASGGKEEQLIWVTGLMGMATISVLGYIIMRFIEQNLTLHEQTSGQLKAARLDALTGIPNRASQEAEVRRAIASANASRSPLTIIVADIDHFKQVNDVHGHGTGDDVLRGFAKRLRRNVGTSGTVGRWGGEEFLVLLPAMSREDAYMLAERLRQGICDSPVAGLPITASFGLASLRPPNDNLEQLFARADEKLYEAKKAGRNTVR